MAQYTTLHRALQDSLTDGGIVDAYLKMPAQMYRAMTVGTARSTGSAVERGATPVDLLTTSSRWMRSAVGRKPPTWATQHDVARVWPIARLRDFSLDPKSTTVPVLVLP